MTLDALIDAMRQRAAASPKLGYRVRLDLDGAGAILIDGTDVPAVISSDNAADADATVSMSSEALAKLIEGALDPTLAFMTGKLKVAGSMPAALKLAAMLED